MSAGSPPAVHTALCLCVVRCHVCNLWQHALRLELLLADWTRLYEADSTNHMWNGFLDIWRPS